MFITRPFSESGKGTFHHVRTISIRNYSSVESKFQPIRLYVYQRNRFAALTDRDLLHFSPSLRMPVGESYPKSTRTVEETISASNIWSTIIWEQVPKYCDKIHGSFNRIVFFIRSSSSESCARARVFCSLVCFLPKYETSRRIHPLICYVSNRLQNKQCSFSV